MVRRFVNEADAIDFDDEEAVLADVAHALEMDPEELAIEEAGATSFRTGTVYSITIGGGMHGKEWEVVRDTDQARELAIAIVTQDLEQEPEIFNQSFIESHIDTKKLKDELWSDVLNTREDDLRDMRDRDFWREWEREGFDEPEEDEDGDVPSPTDEQIEELAERQAEDQLRDPMAYLEDIYGDDAAKEAIRIAGFDVEAAADEAVSTDGEGHFLSGYDGQTHETDAGLVYWRVN